MRGGGDLFGDVQAAVGREALENNVLEGELLCSTVSGVLPPFGAESKAYTAVFAAGAQIALRRGVRLVERDVGHDAVGHVGGDVVGRSCWQAAEPSICRQTGRATKVKGVRGWRCREPSIDERGRKGKKEQNFINVRILPRSEQGQGPRSAIPSISWTRKKNRRN